MNVGTVQAHRVAPIGVLIVIRCWVGPPGWAHSMWQRWTWGEGWLWQHGSRTGERGGTQMKGHASEHWVNERQSGSVQHSSVCIQELLFVYVSLHIALDRAMRSKMKGQWPDTGTIVA